MENQILKDPGDAPMVLTQDGFLQVHQLSTPKEAPPLAPFDCDPFQAHEDLRGKTVEELKSTLRVP